MESLHGHEVISFIQESNPPILEKKLLSTVLKRFGDAKFHNCSLTNLSAGELIEFLKKANKLYFVKGLARINDSNVCSDDD
ncbi:MAG: YecH family protein [Nanoarchaeota archaeon]|nr:YecH family protein [Nanoarchaeota archaeon]MBU1269539.1 YecH family protein [Nanoarchaeota archaeon]MBU1604423.1 YecH family protein [Nanoarchaeota archaeon]MBU2442427.1 YecH family protein [Nanoarchaeota archaeon]